MSQATTFIVAFSAVFGTAEAIRSTQANARRKEHRSRKNNLLIHCPKSSQFSPLLEGRQVVLSGSKLYIDTGTSYDVPFGHPFAGYYYPYPETQYSGLVSTISDDPPVMNWIYVDRETHELKFGTRPWAQPNFKGPWDCTRQDRRLTFGGWEGFYAVRESGGFWALYFDVDQDRLRAKIPEGTPVLDVALMRVEMRTQPPKAPSGAENGGAGAGEEGQGSGEKGSGQRHQEEKQNEEVQAQNGTNGHKVTVEDDPGPLESPDVD